MLNKLEQKIGKYAIPRLTLWLIAGYAVGYVLVLTKSNLLNYMTLDPYYIIHRLQLWRLFTWVLIPPQENIFFAIIMCIFYYSLGNMMERTWGTFRFNVYIFGGLLCTILGAFLLYGGFYLYHGGPVNGIGNFFSTYYINLSIFLAFAACYPEQRVMLYFIFPIRIKILAIVYVVIIFLQAFSYKNYGTQFVICYGVAVLASLCNFLVFWLSNRKQNIKNAARRRKFENAYNSGYKDFKYGNDGGSAFGKRKRTSGWESYQGNGSGSSQSAYNSSRESAAGSSASPRAKTITRHRCAVCGKSELDGAGLEFRFCSKCNGNYEYCREHLFTHTHVK